MYQPRDTSMRRSHAWYLGDYPLEKARHYRIYIVQEILSMYMIDRKNCSFATVAWEKIEMNPLKRYVPILSYK